MLDTSFFLFLFSALLSVLGIAVILNAKYYAELAQESYEHHLFIYITGVISLVSGGVLMKMFSSLGNLEEIIFFVLGVLIILKGICFLVFPKGISFHHKKIFSNPQSMKVLGTIALLFGAFLGLCPFLSF